MTYKNALRVNIGDILHSKDGYIFTVNDIKESSNVANTEKYIQFTGITTRNIAVTYDHKSVGGKSTKI